MPGHPLNSTLTPSGRSGFNLGGVCEICSSPLSKPRSTNPTALGRARVFFGDLVGKARARPARAGEQLWQRPYRSVLSVCQGGRGGKGRLLRGRIGEAKDTFDYRFSGCRGHPTLVFCRKGIAKTPPFPLAYPGEGRCRCAAICGFCCVGLAVPPPAPFGRLRRALELNSKQPLFPFSFLPFAHS